MFLYKNTLSPEIKQSLECVLYKYRKFVINVYLINRKTYLFFIKRNILKKIYSLLFKWNNKLYLPVIKRLKKYQKIFT